MTTASELAVLDPGELESRLTESRKELFNLRFQLATGQLDNSARVRDVRREVARILTVLRDREIQEAEGAIYAAPAPTRRSARVAAARAEEESAKVAAPASTDEGSTNDDDELEEEA